MKLQNAFGRLFRHYPETSLMTTPAPAIPAALQRSVAELGEQLAFIGRSYHVTLWPTTAAITQWQHDIGLMLCYQDLAAIQLQLIGPERQLEAEFHFRFQGGAPPLPSAAASAGFELPLLGSVQIVGHRLVISRNGQSARYARWLKGSWQSASRLAKCPGDTFESDYACHSSAGQRQGLFHVAHARRRLVVTQVGGRGFAFARAVHHALEGILLLPRFAPADHAFTVGQQVTAVVVQTPRGLQARTIQPV